MNVRVMTFTLLFIFSPYLAAGLFDKLVQDVGNAVLKELDSAGNGGESTNKGENKGENSNAVIKWSKKKWKNEPSAVSNPRLESFYAVLRGEKEAKKFPNDSRAVTNLELEVNSQGGYTCRTTYTDSTGFKHVAMARTEVSGTYGGVEGHYQYSDDAEYLSWYHQRHPARSDSNLSDELSQKIAEHACEVIRQDFLEHEAPIIEVTAVEKAEKRKAQIAWESSPEYELTKHYETYFQVRACNGLNTTYVSNSQLKKAKKAIRAIDDKFKKQGVDTEKAYKEAEENPSEQTRKFLGAVSTIKFLGAENNYNQEVKTGCSMLSNALIMQSEQYNAKEAKGKKDF